MFMKDLLVGAEFDHHAHNHQRHQQQQKHHRKQHADTSGDQVRLVVDNARSHPLPGHVKLSPQNDQKTTKRKIDTKKIQQGKNRKRLLLDISDHSKRESRWGGIDKATTNVPRRNKHKALDVSDHSTKDTRWNSSRKLTLEETLSRAIMNHPRRRMSTSADTNNDVDPANENFNKKLSDVLDHSHRESRWDSAETHQERLNDCHSLSPIKEHKSINKRRGGYGKSSRRSRSNESLDAMKLVTDLRNDLGNASAPTIMYDYNDSSTRLALEQVEQAIELVSAALREQSLK